jgi:flavin reductase (DIM6/NTAB) family NADH-FMN oxidoreductase RutF
MSSDDLRARTLNLRRALGSFATGVCIMTIADSQGGEGHAIGMTANSFTSVSLEPPLILWCLDNRAHRYTPFAEAARFGVNILSATQLPLSKRFAREDAHIRPEEGLQHGSDPLRLDGACGYFSCEPHAQQTMGDHLIIIGRVVEFSFDPDLPGLTFHAGRFGQTGGVL